LFISVGDCCRVNYHAAVTQMSRRLFDDHTTTAALAFHINVVGCCRATYTPHQSSCSRIVSN